MKAEKNNVVSIDYVLTDQAGKVLDSSQESAPLAYIHGTGAIIPGLEKALDGRAQGDAFSVLVNPEEAYGERMDTLVQQVPRSQFKDFDDLQVGMQFEVQTNNGGLIVRVVELDDETVTVDGNHPLAGTTLNFDVKVVDVRAATQEELEHGHVHGPGSH